MTTKADKDKIKQLQDKCQSILNALLRDEDNKYCVDCDSKGPRWASWNIGIFLCIRCAGIHRNLGVHISKVKSVNLDSWTPEQVVSLQQMGNSRARAVYEANLPDNHRRPQSDSALDTFIRAKYEHKKYIASEWVPPVMPKVNWEKEINEELERQRRKKKSCNTYLESKPITNVEVPQLPKPTNPSPKPMRKNQSQTKQKSSVSVPVDENYSSSSNATNLLGLQNGEDGFGGFLSASTIDNKNNSLENKDDKKTATQTEEESFFNQLAPTEKEKVKLTKDSILALYSNTPIVNKFNTTFHSQSFNSPFASTQSQQQSFPNFAGATYSPHQPPNLSIQQSSLPAMGAQFSSTTPYPQITQQTNQTYPQQSYSQQQFAIQQQQQQTTHFANTLPAANSFTHMGQFPQQHNNSAFVGQGNMFMMGQNNVLGGNNASTSMQLMSNTLPQQFGNLTLNGQQNLNPTLASTTTNLWQ